MEWLLLSYSVPAQPSALRVATWRALKQAGAVLLGPGLYERNGFRVSGAPGGYDRAGPTLGQDNAWVLGDLLGLDQAEQDRLREVGAVQ